MELGELDVYMVGLERRENQRPHCLVNVVGTFELGCATAFEGATGCPGYRRMNVGVNTPY